MRRNVTFVIIFVIVAILLATAPIIIPIVKRKFTKATHAPASADGIVHANPASLANEANVTIDVYSLGRMIASEEPHSNRIIQVAVAWTTKNYARKKGQSISQILLYSTRQEANGFFGEQIGRYASTKNDPYIEHLDIASMVLTGNEPDPTGGAIQFDRPKVQQILHEREPSKYKSAEQVAQSRQSEGKVSTVIEDVRFWRYA